MTQLLSSRAEALVDQLTIEEQIALMTGADWWNLVAIDRLGIASLGVTDGPNGARGAGGVMGGTRTAAFPAGIAIGASWSADLAHRIGEALALEARDKGAGVLLGPTINLQRGPLNGRNFECFSEDPILTSVLAVAYVEGLQDNGVAATLKHFVANESEIRRTVNSSDVDERTLRELYFVPFERAVKEAGAWAVMSAYNRINGTYAADNHWTLTQVLRKDWGFDGATMSDWFGLHSTQEAVDAGLDLEMPGPSRERGAKLLAAVNNGDVPRERLRTSALNILRLIERTGRLDDAAPRQEVANERAETRALIRQAGADASVLLKNSGVLPLGTAQRIALIGPNARVARVMGGGSAQVNAYRRVSVWDGLIEAFDPTHLSFAQGCSNHRFEPILRGKFTREWFDNEELSGKPILIDTDDKMSCFLEYLPKGIDKAHHSIRISGTFTPESSGDWRFGLHCTGRGRLFLDDKVIIDTWDNWQRGSTFFEEGCDPVLATLDLVAGTPHQFVFEFATKPSFDLHLQAYQVGAGRVLGDKDIEEAVEIATEADTAVICVGRSEEWDTEGWDLPDMTLPGRQNELIERVAARAKKTVVVLQTGGPVEMPWIGQVDAVIEAWYPGQESGHAIADVLTGAANPGGKLPQSFPTRLEDSPTFSGTAPETYPGREGRVVYEEKLDIGYRHHERSGVQPLFPFGFGLSYTNFSLGDPVVGIGSDAAGAVRVPVTNIGSRHGSEVVQLYIAPIDPPVQRPASELKAFAKLHLAPSETGEAVLRLVPRDFAYFNEAECCWTVAPGAYDLRIGTSATDIVHTIRVDITRQSLGL